MDRIIDSSEATNNIKINVFKSTNTDIEEPIRVDISNCITISDMLSNIEYFKEHNYTSSNVIITTNFNNDNSVKILAGLSGNTYEYQKGIFDYNSLDDIEYMCNLYISGELFVGNNITAFSTYSTSDINLKQDIYEIKNSLSDVERLRPVSFNWKDNKEKEVGFIAQEVEDIFPNLVKTNNCKSLKENKLIPYLVDCVKTLKYRIDKLK